MIRENLLYDERKVGDTASIKRVCTANDLFIFAHASGNLNPSHMPDQTHENPPEAVAPSMWVGALVSAVLGNILPGAGTLYKSQSFRFSDRVHVGDELTVTVTVRDKLADGVVRLDTIVKGRGGDTVAEGIAEVLAPLQKVSCNDSNVPELLVQRHRHFDRLLESCRGLEPIGTAVVAPEDKVSLGGALLAAERA